MIVLIPMGGKGSRFTDAGYKENKACILTTDRYSGKKLPMIVCAMQDIPYIHDKNTKIICVDREFHAENGTEAEILKHFPNTTFIHDTVLLDQAYGCYLAKDHLNNDDELIIGACDNGIEYDEVGFKNARDKYDVLMISHTNDTNIALNPHAHSWAKLKDDGSNDMESMSLKKIVSDDYMNDHAATGMFWFKKSRYFLENVEEMIEKKDSLNGKYYVDGVLQYCINNGLKVGVFDVRFICWGTPQDYEIYEQTMQYWSGFLNKVKVD